MNLLQGNDRPNFAEFRPLIFNLPAVRGNQIDQLIRNPAMDINLHHPILDPSRIQEAPHRPDAYAPLACRLAKDRFDDIFFRRVEGLFQRSSFRHLLQRLVTDSGIRRGSSGGGERGKQ